MIDARRVLCGASVLVIGWILGGCQAGSVSIAGVIEPVVADDGYALTTWRLVPQGEDDSLRTPTALVVYATGSEDQTVTRVIGEFAGFAILGARVVLPERRGVRGDEPIDEAATRLGATRGRRIADLAAVVRAASRAVDEGVPLVLVGSSEGADVAAAVAAEEPRVTHLLLLGGGGGWTQADELRHFVRSRPGYLGIHSEAELDDRLMDIRLRPNAAEDWLGHPYRRWNSYLWNRPADDLVKVKRPIFIAHGDRDESVPVESARALRDALSAASSDFEYREYAGADHAFLLADGVTSAFPLVEVDVITWLSAHGVLSPADAASFTARVRAAHPRSFRTPGSA